MPELQPPPQPASGLTSGSSPGWAPSASAEALYRGLVATRARHPVHAGALDGAALTAAGSNPLCGDKVEISLRCDDADVVRALRHRTDGCAICCAASDLMADSVLGLPRSEVQALWQRFERLLRDGAAGLDEADRERLGLLNAFADLHEYRSRRKCAILPWSALLAALGSVGDA